MSAPDPSPASTGALPPRPRPDWARRGLWTALAVAVFAWSIQGTEFSVYAAVTGIPHMWNLVARMMPPNFAYAPRIWRPLAETLRIAIVATTVGAVLAVPFSLLAAANLARWRGLYLGVKAVLNLLRTVPDIALASVLVGIVGLGPMAGIIAVAVFTFTLIAKLLSESIEAIDPGPMEALQAVGAGRLQTIAYAVVPQVLPHFIGYTLYAFEINVRVAFVLGLVGAGGIGQLLYRDLNFLLYRNVSMVILATLVAVMLIDFASTKLRERLL